ncbi:hypothetical protein RFY41_08985, partial [Acinetobacter soli]
GISSHPAVPPPWSELYLPESSSCMEKASAKEDTESRNNPASHLLPDDGSRCASGTGSGDVSNKEAGRHPHI